MKLTKQLAALVLVSVFSAASFAQISGQEQFKATMKEMGLSLKALSVGLIKNKEITPDVKAAAHKLAELSALVANHKPEQVTDANAKDYQGMMSALVVATKNLDEAVAADKLEEAQGILKNQVMAVQRNGHEAFKQ